MRRNVREFLFVSFVSRSYTASKEFSSLDVTEMLQIHIFLVYLAYEFVPFGYMYISEFNNCV